MTKTLLSWLYGLRRTRVQNVQLHLISASALLQAQQEAQELAAGDEKRLGLCVNACILARAAKKDGKCVFSSGKDVLERLSAQSIGQWTKRYLALCEKENPSCFSPEHEALRKQLENETYERLKWRVLRTFGVLPSEQRAKQMTDGDYLYCVLQLLLDEQQELSLLCPGCRERVREPRCPVCGALAAEQNDSFDMQRYEELKRQ